MITINENPIGFQDSFGLAFEVLELTVVDRPTEHSQYGEYQQRRQGNQDVEDIHAQTPLTGRPARDALVTTSSELSAMPRPAAQGGNQPMAASGTQEKL